MDKYIISACLCGVNCKYNGKNNLNLKCLDLLKQGKALLICPEQLGGLQTPRKPSEINKGRVINIEGEDVTANFVRGAEEALKIAQNANINKAILKEGSPSCGVKRIYDGTFTSNKINGQGITAKLFKEKNIQIVSSEDI